MVTICIIFERKSASSLKTETKEQKGAAVQMRERRASQVTMPLPMKTLGFTPTCTYKQ